VGGVAAAPLSAEPGGAAGRRLRVAVLCDFAEEGWPSMDLVGARLVERLLDEHADAIDVHRIHPRLPRRARRLTRAESRTCFNADRLAGRFLDYPSALVPLRGRFDVFHVADHSYSQLVLALPSRRTVVTCHDLDTFRSVLDPAAEPRSLAFRAMTRCILSGFRRAAHVTCDSETVRGELLRHRLLPPERSTVVPLGVEPLFSPTPDPVGDADAAALLGPRDPRAPELLHVGSTIPRKRVGLLLQSVTELRRRGATPRLVRVGGPLPPDLHRLASGFTTSVVSLPFLSRRTLAAVYRRAAAVVLPSESEGFGLPVLEALASATPVVASDLAVLREVGGDEVFYCGSRDPADWASAVERVLDARRNGSAALGSRLARGRLRAARYTWSSYARRMRDVYRAVAAP
jgi:glycosyltransferase involved in cell wall biosynthesis